MSKTKAGGSSKNVHDSPGQRLGVKRFAGETVRAGEVIVRQIGRTKLAGVGTRMSRNFTIFALKDGVVSYRKTTTRRFTGKNVPRTEVSVK